MAVDARTRKFLKDLSRLQAVPVTRRYSKWALEEYPFDLQLLSLSGLYRESRRRYLELGGDFFPRVCSTMRSLSAQDLFADAIDFTPAMSELAWFHAHSPEVADPAKEIESLMRFCEISLYHEQNHRILWRLLPPAPKQERAFRRYLNFAESLVVTLDLALGDELGKDLSTVFERLKVIYRPGDDSWRGKSRLEYRCYLLVLLCATHCLLEGVHPGDILKVVDYVLPGSTKMKKAAVRRSLELSESFTRTTNPEWQKRFWKQARAKLGKIKSGSSEEAFVVAEDPLDLEAEFEIANRVLNFYGI